MAVFTQTLEYDEHRIFEGFGKTAIYWKVMRRAMASRNASESIHPANPPAIYPLGGQT
jgi:hypothetical protein